MTVDPILNDLASAVTESEDLESLVRPLLELLQRISGLEATCLTRIDAACGVERVLYACNSRRLQIPEGMEIPWGGGGAPHARASEADERDECGDGSGAGDPLGLKTRVSAPVRLYGEALYGTLCAASERHAEVAPDALALLSLFAHLIGHQIERERVLQRLRAEHREFSLHALTDPLTGIANRRALIRELERALAHARRLNVPILVAFIDLDGFKAINDDHGHDAGDRFLIQMTQALSAGLREGDFLARIGGDEFVVFGLGSPEAPETALLSFCQRLEELTRGDFDLGPVRLRYGGASVGAVASTAQEQDPEALLARADAAMYAVKRSRRANAPR